jgi:hypothetical protein
MDLSELFTVLLGGGVVTAMVTIIKGWGAVRQNVRDREDVILEDLRRHREEVEWWKKRDEEMGQRIVGGGRRLEIPVLKNPPPPPPTARATPVVVLPREEPAAKAAAPVEVCPHLFCHPVTDVLGTELARICIACDAQVTNEEWVRVGW